MTIGQIDKNLQTIRHVQGTWGMPELPDMVALDLAAMPDMNPAGLETLLYGMDSEVTEVAAPPPAELDLAAVDVEGYDPQGEVQTAEPAGRVGARWYGGLLMGGAGRPHELVDDPVIDWKERAVRAGYLEGISDEEMQSTLWRPEYNNINNQMARDRWQYGVMGGNEGALTVQETNNIFDDWLSPTGWVRAMTEMDLLWDPGKIGSEFMDWDDRIAQAWHDLVPSWMGDEEGNFSWRTPFGVIAAASGPLDDIVVPALNWFLLLVPGANAYVGLKGLLMGGKIAQAGRTAKTLGAMRGMKGPVGAMTRAMTPAQRFETLGGVRAGAQATRLQGFGKPSGLSSYMMGGIAGQYPGRVGQATFRAGQRMAGTARAPQFAAWAGRRGAQMQTWRNYRAVQAMKLGVQTVAKAGVGGRVMGTVTNRLGDGLNQPGEGAFSLEDVGIIEDFRDDYLQPRTVTGAFGNLAFDLMFIPYALYEPGTIKHSLRAMQLAGNKALHAAGHVIPPLKRTLERVKSAGGRGINTFYERVREYMEAHKGTKLDADGKPLFTDEKIERYERIAREEGPGEALHQVFAEGMEADDFGHAYFNILWTVALEHAARQVARTMDVTDNIGRSGPYLTVYHQLMSQTRSLDPYDIQQNLYEMARQARMDNIFEGGKHATNREAVEAQVALFEDHFRESVATARARGTDVGEGYVRLIRVQDPDSDAKWFRVLEAGESLPDDARVLDLHLEEYASYYGTSVDDVKHLFTPGMGHNLPESFLGGNRIHGWGDIQAGRVRRWDHEKAKWMWDTDIVDTDTGAKMKGLVQNHNDKRDATIAELMNNLESGAEQIQPGLRAQVSSLEKVEAPATRLISGYSPTVPALAEALTDEILDRFQNWNAYIAAVEELGVAVSQGAFMDAKFTTAMSPGMRRLSMYPIARDNPNRPRPYAGHIFGEKAGDYNYIQWINKGMYAPLLRALDPAYGRATIARWDTVVKQEALEFAAQVTFRHTLLRTVRHLKTTGAWGKVEETGGQILGAAQGNKNITRKMLREFLGQLLEEEAQTGERVLTKAFGSKKTQGRFGQIMEYALRNDIQMQELEDLLVDDLASWAMRDEWVSRFGLSNDIGLPGADMAEFARKRAKQLKAEAQWIAAEVDPTTFSEEYQHLAASLREKGYKVVHGVEFTDPRQISHLLPEIAWQNQKINSRITLGLSRQNPQWLSHLATRTVKAKLAGNLARARNVTGDYQPAKFTTLEDGTKVIESYGRGIRPEFADGDPNGNGVRNLFNLLNNVVDDINTHRRTVMDQVELRTGLAGSSRWRRTLSRLMASRDPYTVRDMGAMNYKEVRSAVEGMMPDIDPLVRAGEKAKTFVPGQKPIADVLTDDEFRAVWDALKASRKLENGMSVRGLAHLEDHLRSRPNLLNVLTVLKRHKAGDFMRWSEPGGRAKHAGTKILPWTAAFVAGSTAAGAASYQHQRDPSFGGSRWQVGLEAGVAGALGMGAGRMATRKLFGAVPDIRRGASTAQEITDLQNKSGIRQILGGWPAVFPGGDPGKVRDVFQYTDWQRYAYLTDFGVNMRDYMRFTLSPIFDASRYAEATVLSQVVGNDVAQGLRLNQSPQAFRNAMTRDFMRQGVDKGPARALANDEWGKIRSSFMDQAKGLGDFDWENTDNLARWFTSIGILGFSPQAWMASTFGQLMRSGVDPSLAYKTSREIYTYGMTGRSAAEQSINMVFFPFSFMKKTLNHFRQYMMEDLSRAVIIHDMIKAYEMVDEKYDLSERWKDYLPLLEKTKRLNLLNYGLALGEFGGPNAPLLRGLFHSPLGQGAEALAAGAAKGAFGVEYETSMNSPFIHAIFPNAVSINSESDYLDVMKTVKRIMPVINDFQHLVGDVVEQAEVGFSPHHVTKEEQNERAWEEWNLIRDDVKKFLNDRGLPYSAINRTTGDFPKLKAWLDQQKARLLHTYPSWGAEMAAGAENAAVRNIELTERINNPMGEVDLAVTDMDNYIGLLRDEASSAGYSLSDVDFLPPDLHRLVREAAAYIVRSVPEFLAIYNRLWARDYGPISREII